MKSDRDFSYPLLTLSDSLCTTIILTHILLLGSILFAQPKERIELQINKCSGTVFNSLTDNPIYAVKVEILSGNNEPKDSTYTDHKGNYYMDPVGYLWRPRIRFTSYDFENKMIMLNENHLDEQGIMNFDISLEPIPESEKPKVFSKGTVASRAKTFFWKGNVYYYLENNSIPSEYNASRIIINEVSTEKSPQGELLISINGQKINPLLCYVPQDGMYENLLAILSGYLPEPLFDDSGLPRYLDEDLLEPTVVFGRIMDALTDKPVMGAEVSIIGISVNKRITGSNGKYAFQILEAGEFFLNVVPPIHSRYNKPSKSKLIIKEARGGWHQSDQILFPKERFHWAK